MSHAYSEYDAISDWRSCPDDVDPLEYTPGAIRSLIDIRPIATSREKQLTLLAAVLGTSVVFLDATVTSVALPAIRGDLGGGLAGQQWVTNAYLLTLASLLLIGGSLGDVFGQKRVFLVGVAGFGLTSALCAVASSIPELCVFRSMQGVCAALVTPTALAVIIHVFPEDERARAIGTWTALSSIVGVIGPFIGGVLIAAGSWRLIFLLNAPLVLVTVTLIARGVPEERERWHRRASGLPWGPLGGGRALGFGVRCDRGAGARMEHPGGRLARGRDSGSHRVYCARGASPGADAPIEPVSRAQLHDRKPGDIDRLPWARGCDLSAACVSAGGQRLQPRSGGACASAGHLADDRALPPLRRTRRPHRVAGADKPRGAGCRMRPFALGACRSARRLRQRGPAGAARVRVGTRDACRAVDRHGPWGSGGGSRRRRRRGEYDALTRRAALRGRCAGSRRLSCVCQSRRRDATTDPRSIPPAARRSAAPSDSLSARPAWLECPPASGFSYERPSRTRPCMPSVSRTRSQPCSSPAEV